MDNIIALVGFGLQYLRAFPWFKEPYTAAVVLVTATIASLMNEASYAVWTQLAMSHGKLDVLRASSFVANDLASHVLTVMGGLGIAMISSHSSGPIRTPKFNEFGKES